MKNLAQKLPSEPAPAETRGKGAAVPSPSAAMRERLGSDAGRTFFNIMQLWKVRDEDARPLLGEISSKAFQSMKKDSKHALDEDKLRRISFLIGIFKALNTLYDKELADEWMQLPNKNNIFQGKKPIEHLKHGGLPAFAEVRKLLDARRVGF